MTIRFRDCMRSTRIVLSVTLGLAAAGCEGEGMELDQSVENESSAIIGGTAVSDQTRYDLGLAEVNGICSGSLFHRDWVITASHCIVAGAVNNNWFSIPKGSIGNGSTTRRARRIVRMDASDLTLVELEPIPANSVVIWPSITRTSFNGEVASLRGSNITCYGRGGSGYAAGGGLIFDGWHTLTRLVNDIVDGNMVVPSVGSPGSQNTAPGDSGGPCYSASGAITSVVSAGQWNCLNPASDGSCRASINDVTRSYWLVTKPWAGIINAISGKKPVAVWDGSFSDANGWNGGRHYYSTIAYADVSGDTRADVCGRGGNGIWCGISSGDREFAGTRLWLPSFSDGNGWNRPEYYSTIKFPDLNGDGKKDVCGRGGDGVYCALSDGATRFVNDVSGPVNAALVWEESFSDGNGWSSPEYYRTLQFPDVNGDGKADVCGRGGNGIWCATSTGRRFNNIALWIADFDDARGWRDEAYYSTIQFPDVNGDGKADVCGRGSAGIRCALSTGSSFTGVKLWNSNFSDAAGWNGGPQYYSTIRFPDVNGDHKADVCGRGGGGIWCAISGGNGFATATLWIANFADAGGWNGGPQYYSTIQFPDLDADGRADVCGRGGAGVYCAASNGTGFAGLTLWDDSMSDSNGWNAAPYYSTIRFPDIDSDWNTEVCGRGGAGIYCER